MFSVIEIRLSSDVSQNDCDVIKGGHFHAHTDCRHCRRDRGRHRHAELAASKKSVRTHMAEMKAKDPQNYAACTGLAEQRGFRADTETPSGLMMFIDGCIMGKQH